MNFIYLWFIGVVCLLASCGQATSTVSYCEIGMTTQECSYQPITFSIAATDAETPRVVKTKGYTYLLSSIRRNGSAHAPARGQSWWFLPYPDSDAEHSPAALQTLLMKKGLINADFCKVNTRSFVCSAEESLEFDYSAHGKKVEALVQYLGSRPPTPPAK